MNKKIDIYVSKGNFEVLRELYLEEETNKYININTTIMTKCFKLNDRKIGYLTFKDNNQEGNKYPSRSFKIVEEESVGFILDVSKMKLEQNNIDIKELTEIKKSMDRNCIKGIGYNHLVEIKNYIQEVTPWPVGKSLERNGSFIKQNKTVTILSKKDIDNGTKNFIMRKFGMKSSCYTGEIESLSLDPNNAIILFSIEDYTKKEREYITGYIKRKFSSQELVVYTRGESIFDLAEKINKAIDNIIFLHNYIVENEFISIESLEPYAELTKQDVEDITDKLGSILQNNIRNTISYVVTGKKIKDISSEEILEALEKEKSLGKLFRPKDFTCELRTVNKDGMVETYVFKSNTNK